MRKTNRLVGAVTGSDRELLFRIVPRDLTKEVRIYTNGDVEGFGKDFIVINYFPVLSATEAASLYRLQLPSAESLRAENTELDQTV